MMIRLIFKFDGQTVERSFSQSTVTIGLDSPDLEGLPLNSSELDREHLKFVEQNGEIYAINEANDPFTTLNGRPFGRKKLVGGDQLEVGQIEILYSGTTETGKNLPDSFDPETKSATLASFEEDDDLKSLIAQVEDLEHEDDEEGQEPSSVIIHQNMSFTHEQERQPARWRPHKEAAEEYEQQREDPYRSQTSIWGSVIAYVAVLLAIIATLGSGLYFTFSEQSDAQEFITAEGVADISMAFTYAHQHQIKPAHQNWSDGDFINNMLAKFLPEGTRSYASVDRQSNFTNTDYLLRVYWTPDLSRFLLIAQPNPTLLQWLLPRATIVIDSQSMELRHTTELKELNRLLANPSPLDGDNAAAIFKLISEAKLVRLATLAQETGHTEFNPPASLSQTRSTATSLVYNAPRYYLFAQPLMQALADSQEGKEQRILEELLRSWRKFPDLVLYAKEDKKIANSAFNTLKERFPKETFLVAYIGAGSNTAEILTEPLEDLSHADLQEQESTPVDQQELERLAQRKHTLKPLSKQIKQWLDTHTSTPQTDFYDKLTSFIQGYHDRDLALQGYPAEKLVTLAFPNLQGGSRTNEEGVVSQEMADAILEQFQTFADQIQEAKTLGQLQATAREVALWEKSARTATSTRFSAFSNKLRAQLLRRLELLLFSAASPLQQEDLQPRQRVVVQSILNNIGIEDPYQRDYYLKEFDLLVERN